VCGTADVDEGVQLGADGALRGVEHGMAMLIPIEMMKLVRMVEFCFVGCVMMCNPSGAGLSVVLVGWKLSLLWFMLARNVFEASRPCMRAVCR